MRRAGLTCTLALALGLVPCSGRAAPRGRADPAAQQAAELFDQGSRRYETADYAAAIELFTQAYELAVEIEHEKTRNDAVARLLYNLAGAHLKAWEVDRDPAHLRQAIDLLEKHGEQASDPADRADGEARLAQAREQLAAFEAARPPPAPAPPDRRLSAADHKAERDAAIRRDPELWHAYRSGRRLVIGGAICLGAAGAFGLTGLYLAVRTGGDREVAGVLGGTMAILVAGTLIPGLVMLPIGAKRKRDAITEAEQQVALGPWWDAATGSGGAVAYVRF
jgi:tetratricopeptide (TPR) repeat protein